MDSRQDELHELTVRIEALLQESYSLKRTRDSWHRHIEIQAEIMKLCRNAADLHPESEAPYWMSETDGSSDSQSDESKAA